MPLLKVKDPVCQLSSGHCLPGHLSLLRHNGQWQFQCSSFGSLVCPPRIIVSASKAAKYAPALASPTPVLEGRGYDSSAILGSRVLDSWIIHSQTGPCFPTPGHHVCLTTSPQPISGDLDGTGWQSALGHWQLSLKTAWPFQGMPSQQRGQWARHAESQLKHSLHVPHCLSVLAMG